MRTLQQVQAADPPLFDILVWEPIAGRFERHARPDTVPMGLFPTEAADLPLILPNKTPGELDALAMEVSGHTV
ncbi:MAG TPA: hypothetical protein VL285_21415, partial [Bryobacteraceae bacterium]|nr:hypothetical protein [Bryobacteraceae bacterium]